ncbi:MAG: SdrD B-like domain-containing protein [Coriobacteriia bacterium]
MAAFALDAPVTGTTTETTAPAPVVSEPAAPEEPVIVEEPVAPEAITPQEPVPTTSESAASSDGSEIKSVPPADVTFKEVAPLTAAVGPLVARDDFPEPIVVGEGCDLTTIAILWAGQNYEAGTVSVTNDAENVYVTFTTTGGWTLEATHLYVGTTPPSSFAPGSFPYQQTHSSVTTYTYTVSLVSIGAVAGDTIYIAAHAEVSNDGLNLNETGWAGVGTWPGLVFSHVVQECPAELGSITVIKFNDLNGNGVRDDGEPLLPGIDFSATMGETVLTDTTDAQGEAQFMDLADGTYVIDETLPAGWVATTELPLEVIILNGQDATVYVGNMEEPVLPFTPPDLAIAKAAGVTDASPGELVTYVLTYRNVSGSNATDFRIVDDFDERYIAIADAGGGVVVNGTIVWDLAGPLAVSDGPQTLTYTARVRADMPIGTTRVGNVAVISHPLDVNLVNNEASDVIVVDNPILPFTDEEPFLPFTGSDAVLLGLVMLTLAFAGTALRFAARTS